VEAENNNSKQFAEVLAESIKVGQDFLQQKYVDKTTQYCDVAMLIASEGIHTWLIKSSACVM
jgi:hypothetical protein